MDGFAAVVTTGIYCRPGCGARPKRENVRTFPVAAAAEAAGHRACLRCRPYRSPMSVPWTGSELICRAVRLILSGALDEGREPDLATRLGISVRHLRRLFTNRLGVTPDGLARSARAHFARRLLDDTDLTVTEVAYAAGFGSLRQFNRVLQEVFRAPPSELRARRRSTDRLVADGGLALRLPFAGALDWDAMLEYFAARAIPGVERVCPYERSYRRTVMIDDDPGVLELVPGDDQHLILRAHLPHWEGLIHVADRARQIANLDLDPLEAVAHLSGDELIGPLVSAAPGLRPPGTWDPYEAGVRTIVAGGLPASAGNALVGRLVERLGRPVGGLTPLGLHRIFPPPPVLASADLDAVGIPAARVAALRPFARAVAEGTLLLDRSVGLDQLVATIVEVTGVALHTAHRIALRLGEPDACPVSGPHATLLDRWRPWRAFGAAHLQRVAGPGAVRAA